MRTDLAFAMGETTRFDEPKVFDWDKAASIIAERKPNIAEAGLAGDMEYTSGVIYKKGKPYLNRGTTFLASTWATPVLVLNDSETIECYKYQSEVPHWGPNTFWPRSAKRIVKEAMNDKG